MIKYSSGVGEKHKKTYRPVESETARLCKKVGKLIKYLSYLLQQLAVQSFTWPSETEGGEK